MEKEQTETSASGLRPRVRASARLVFLLSFFFLVPFLHAAPQAWQPAVGAALVLNILVVALMFMVITALHLDHFKGMVYEEGGQLLVTMILAALLIGGLSDIEGVSHAIGCAGGTYSCSLGPVPANDLSLLPLCSTMVSSPGAAPVCPALSVMDWSQRVTAGQIALLEKQVVYATEFNAKMGAVSSVSAFCNLMGTGLTVAGCSAYGVMRGPSGQLINAVGFGLMELKAQQILLALAQNYALALLLPLGLLLRSLHFTRKAGGTLIALALSIYLILPISILLAQSLVDGFLSLPTYNHLGVLTSSTYPSVKFDYNALAAGGSITGAIECDPTDPDEQHLVDKVNGLLAPMDAQGNAVMAGSLESGSSLAERVMFMVIVRTLMMGALALTMTITAVRVLGKMFGAEIEVWSIARLS
ncbi:Uncharacterised protein [uncultured archaeon]|nr:Uncharacterised protein [uncultured archaeon]